MEIMGDIAGVEVWDGSPSTGGQCWACVRMLAWCEGAFKLVVTVTTCTLSHTHTHTPPHGLLQRGVESQIISDNLSCISAVSQLYLR